MSKIMIIKKKSYKQIQTPMENTPSTFRVKQVLNIKAQ